MDAGTAQEIAANLAAIRKSIGEAAAQRVRGAGEVTLIAVSKGQPTARILPALAAGQRVFGENYVQEAAQRWPALRERHQGLELHLIGALQSNKTADAVRLFDVIQTLDRPKLAAALAKEFARQGVVREIFVEVNTGEEPQKAGVLPAALDGFIAACRREHGLAIAGLMAIPPAHDEISLHAALLGELAARNGVAKLSIGMSADFAVAIRFGATHVRVGTAIFGQRPAAASP